VGSVVEYRCEACTFSSGALRIGWGKSGQANFWGGLVRCDLCSELGVADIAAARDRTSRDLRCGHCGGLLTRLEGTSVSVPCPRCRSALRHQTLGTWS
jgi:Mu-like prophage protein Com